MHAIADRFGNRFVPAIERVLGEAREPPERTAAASA
jgi:hypothetical protein